MLELSLGTKTEPLRSILCLGAHCDDIEIGCGATLVSLAKANTRLSIRWIILSGDEQRESEARSSAEELLGPLATVDISVERFRDSYFPFEGGLIKEYMASVKANEQPDLVLTHSRRDRHQDHRTVSELTWNLFRDHTILEYEIPKYEGDLGAPNVYFPISKEALDRKCGAIMRCYASQSQRSWFTDETFRALARLRGIESNSESGYAEAFVADKIRIV